MKSILVAGKIGPKFDGKQVEGMVRGQVSSYSTPKVELRQSELYNHVVVDFIFDNKL